MDTDVHDRSLQRYIYDPGKQSLFLLLVSFILAFLFIRLSTRMIRAQVSWWPGNVAPGGLHIHHVVFGTAFALTAGVGSFSPAGRGPPWREIFAYLFGVGAALILDEFALILHLEDVYCLRRAASPSTQCFSARR